MKIHYCIFGITWCLIADSVLMQSGFLLEVDCDKILNCTDLDPVCGSDRRTYDSTCHLELENQQRYCIVGDFDKISLDHPGHCDDENHS